MTPATSTEPPREEHRKVEILARLLYGDIQIGMLGAGLEGDYMASPYLGVGLQLTSFFVDQGAEFPFLIAAPDGSLTGGSHWLAFGELDLLPQLPITPYVRLGLGVGSYRRVRNATSDIDDATLEVETAGVAQASFGVAFRLGPVLLRAAAAPSLYGRDRVVEYSVGLGLTGLERLVARAVVPENQRSQ